MRNEVNTNDGVCDRANDLVAYVYRDMSEASSSEFERHLATCSHCRADLSEFSSVREAVGIWRHEMTALVPRLLPTPAISERALSAMKAFREFFSLSPMWLRGATAFATMMLLTFSVVGARHLMEPPAPIVPSVPEGTSFTREQVQSLVADAVRQERDRVMAEVARAEAVQLSDDGQKSTGERRSARRNRSSQVAMNPSEEVLSLYSLMNDTANPR